MKKTFFKRPYQPLLIILLTTSCSDSLKLETKVPTEKVAHVTTGEVETIPSAPSKLVVLGISGSEGVNPFPTIRVEGVKSGYTVKIFSDSSCTQELGSAVASGTSVDVTVSSELSLGTYTFYSQSSNTLGSSPCSTANVEYTLVSCPDKFIPVSHNTDVGTNKDFCVMKYEARKNTSDLPESIETGSPWNKISASDALAKCIALGTGYDLISNPEWMTIARSIEATESNWINGFGTGLLVRGHSDGSPTDSCSSESTQKNVNGSCSETGVNADQLRTHTLENGKIIWDFSGNGWEWVDWNAADIGFQLGPLNCTETNIELNAVSCLDLVSNQYRPQDENLISSNYVGKFIGGTGGAAARGGAWGSELGAGIYALRLDFNDSTPNSGITFRCVYRP